MKSVDSGAPHKDEHGFWINAQKEAVAEALATGRPLLIDFYGIWCPPCNLFNEFVFPKTEFQKAAANYVLLKLDADQEASWELKSKFKIAGYPTLLFARLNSVNGKTELQEINRVAGFHDLASLSQEMNATYARRLENPNGVLAGGPGSPDYIPALKKQIDFEIDQHEYAAVLDHATAGIAAAPNDAGFKLFRQVALMGLNHDVYKKDKTKLSAFLTAGETPAILYRIQKQKKISNPTTLLRGAELINQALDLLDDPKFSDLQHLKTQAMDYLNELYTRINPKTMFIDGVEMSQGDLDEMRGDLAEATHDEVLLKKTYEDGVKTYEKMIAIYHEKDSRGLNLEYAYFLRKSGRIKQAKALYSRFIKKYPQEFTFYYPFAKLYVETKELNMAFIMAENAVAYAYGDNKIRCVELLAKVMAAQGENAKAIETITQFLASFKAPPIELRLRTQRYLDSLAELKEKLKAGKPS